MKKLQSKIFIIVLILMLAFGSGCGSIAYRHHNKGADIPYGGTMLIIYWSALSLNPFILIDLPGSFLVDTILLPRDIILMNRGKR